MLKRPHHYRFASLGFTLVELMISIALVLLLVVGINQVFSLTSKTIGTGQASSNAQRDMRAAKKVMEDDFDSALTTSGPCFIINNQRVWAFRNKQDQLSDPDGQANTADLQNVGTQNVLSPAFYNYRNHRIDQIKFFARGRFHRQTGDNYISSFLSATNSNEAWITYGHAVLPNNTNTYATPTGTELTPGAGTVSTNPNNFYASQWMLIHQAILLVPSVKSESAFRRVSRTPNPPDLSPLNPLANTATKPTFPLGSTGVVMKDSIIDLAEGSIDSFGVDLAARIRAGTYTGTNIVASPVWYRQLSTTSIPSELSSNNAPYGSPYTSSNFTDLLFRFHCNPYITRPLTSKVAAQASPQFVTGCSQFIVEFAGDFVTQSDLGDVTDSQPDGTIDFVIPDKGFPNAGVRQIRWYGLPRDTDGDGIINGQYMDNTNVFPKRWNNSMPDVVPLRDVIWSGGANDPVTGYGGNIALRPTATNRDIKAPFECEVNVLTNAFPTAPAIYGVPLTTAGVPNDYAQSMNANSNYLCIWTNGGPSMIRIIMTVDDPNGRLPDGAQFEYVFSLKK